MRLKIFICLLLAGVTMAIYWPVRYFDFIYLDDPFFIANPEVATGLNWHGFHWAMTDIVAANWHPVTLFSFLLTHRFFGLNPGAEHLVNAAFHAANAVLLFILLVKMTGTTWRSAVAAAIFAWHPLRVESVAWISERKDVLFLFFMLLSLLCYERFAWAKQGGLALKAEAKKGFWRQRIWYVSSLLFFILSFMSKAMVVTLPFLLLLLDFWPLRRFNRQSVRGLLVEKIPFFALTIFFSALTFHVQDSHAATRTLAQIGMAERFEIATMSYLNYLFHFFWPTKLAAFYPRSGNFDTGEIVLAGLLLMAISALCIMELSRRPYLAMGWFWFFGTMVPVIGLVQIGGASMADRYTYLPLIGPTMSLVWLISEWVSTNVFRKYSAALTATIVLAVCIFLTRRQLEFWQNTVTLLSETVAVTSRNDLAEFPLAVGLEHEGRSKEAAVHYRIAIMLAPYNYRAHYQLASFLTRHGYKQEGLAEYQAAVSTGCDQGDYEADMNMADAQVHLGRYEDAETSLETALQVNPGLAEAMNNLAWLLATCPDASIRNGERAVQLAERACQLTENKQTIFIGTLGAAYAEAGRFDDAAVAAQKAIANAQKNGETPLIQRNEELLKLYQAHQAYHEEEKK